MSDAEFTQADFDKWVSVQIALSEVAAIQGRSIAVQTIARRLATDQIKARADRLLVNGKVYDKPFPLIRIDVWEEFASWDYLSEHAFWRSSDLKIKVPKNYPDNDIPFDIFGIRFESAGIEKITGGPNLGKLLQASLNKPVTIAPPPAVAAPAPPPPPPPPPVVSRAGRPPLDFWEDMVIAATRAILYDDTLKPKTIADVQRWMTDWAIAKGHDPGETAIKERARRVFLACQ